MRRSIIGVCAVLVLWTASCADNTMRKIIGSDTIVPDTDTTNVPNDYETADDGDYLADDEDETLPDMAADIDTTRPDSDTIDSVCIDHWDCSEGMFCHRSIGACTGPGTCNIMPLQCNEAWVPVCGCDGITYPNECTAHRGGHNIAYDGECQPGPLCLDSTDCSAETFCLPPVGMCGTQGTCHPYPDNECPPETAIVCGCNGVTYDNECFARLSGIGIAHLGPCGSMISCTTNKQCTATEYCAKSVGMCGGNDPGKCDLRPVTCEKITEPLLVCGCNGVTYDHPCFAALAGVNILHEGVCEGQNVCLKNEECDETEFCRKAWSICNTGSGACEARPDACAMKVPGEPVCGCDGLTYPDECVAHASGVNVAFGGSCEDAIPKSSLFYHYNTSENPSVNAYAYVALSKEETAEFTAAGIVEKVNTNPVSIILRVTYSIQSPIPEQESVMVQISLPRTANIPYNAALDNNANYVRWLDMFGNVKATFLGTITVTRYETDNDFPNYTVIALDFFGEKLTPAK